MPSLKINQAQINVKGN